MVCRWCVVWCVTDLSARLLLVHLFVCLWFVTVLYQFVVTGPSLIHLLVRLLVHYWSFCSFVVGLPLVCHWSAIGLPLVCHWSAIGLPLVRLLELWSLVRGSCIARPSTRVVAALSLGSSRQCFASVRLFDSPPCVQSYSLCWLNVAVTLFTHTLFHAWCPVTLLSLTCCSRVVVLLESFWSPSGVLLESFWSPSGVLLESFQRRSSS